VRIFCIQCKIRRHYQAVALKTNYDLSEVACSKANAGWLSEAGYFGLHDGLLKFEGEHEPECFVLFLQRFQFFWRWLGESEKLLRSAK
jgi:hypothetical protein